MTDAGTLTDCSLAVVAGDTVAWDATNEVWYKAMNYAPAQYGTNEVHNLPTTATEADLVAGNYLALDGSTGTKKLPAEDVAKRSVQDELNNTAFRKGLLLGDTSIFADVNDLPVGSCYVIAAGLANRPVVGRAGVCFTFGSKANGYAFQIYKLIASDGMTDKYEVYTRHQNNGNWGAWICLASLPELTALDTKVTNDEAKMFYKGVVLGDTSLYSDVNSLPFGSCYVVAAALANRPQNSGGTSLGGICQTVGSTAANYAFQLYCANDGNGHELFYRLKKSGTWTSWYQIARESEIAKLAADVSDIYNRIESVTLDGGALWTDATKYIYKDGTILSGNGSITDYIEIKKGMRFEGRGKGVSGNLCSYYFYDENKAPISGYKCSNSDYEDFSVNYDDIPPNARYVMFCKWNTYTEAYTNIEWNAIIYTDQVVNEAVGTYTDLFVTTNGANDGVRNFTSLVNALYASQTISGKTRIYISSGTYDVLEELGGMAYILTKDKDVDNWKDVQPVVHNVEIIGLGRVVLNFKITYGTPQDNYWLFSCLNFDGECKVENIEINASNCRYCIHDEAGNDAPNTKREYVNVRLIKTTDGGQAYGAGYSADTRAYFKDCLFSESWTNAWSCHANNGCAIVFDNCEFEMNRSTTAKPVRISQNGNVSLYAKLSNCYIGQGGLTIRSESGDATDNKTKIDLLNTSISAIDNQYTTSSEQVVSYNSLAGTKTILLDITE
jgi:hypothetical protein